MKFEYADGATPLSLEDIAGLIPKHITTQEQLNEWEYANILRAEKWAYGRKHRDLLSISFLCLLHKKMFDQSWTWAGKFRTSQTNIGISWHNIPEHLKLLCDDFGYHMTHHTFPADELAVRFHHRLVWIHLFPNGNGRHARLMANLLAIHLGQKPLSWGLSSKSSSLIAAGTLRSDYLSALRKADQGDVAPLIKFARS